ncbi:MAG: hypothetical protein QM715_12445 [Nibricoccus sp.]
MSEPGLNYKVTVSGASQGAADVSKLADASGKVADATGKAAPQAKGLADAISSLGSRNNPAKDALEGLSSAARGGEGSVFGLTKAFRAFRELINGGFAALGPGGILVAGLGLVIGLLPKIIELFKGTSKSAEELAAESKKAADEVKELGQQRMEALAAGFAAANEAAKKANAEFERALNLQKRLNEAARNAELAENPDKAKEINAKYDQKNKALTLTAKEFAASQADEVVKAAASNQEDAFNAEVRAKKELIELLKKEGELKKLNALIEQNKYTSELSKESVAEQKKREDQAKALQNQIAKKPEIEAEVAARIKESQRAADNLTKAKDTQSTARAELKTEEIGQKAEADSSRRIENVEEKKRISEQLSDATKRRQNAGDRSEFLAAAQDEIAARNALKKPAGRGKSEAANAEQAPALEKAAEEIADKKVDDRPLKEAASAISTAIEQSVSDSNRAISEGAQAIRAAVGERMQVPDLEPLVSTVKQGFSTVNNAMRNMQQQINQNSYAIREIINQMSSARNK